MQNPFNLPFSARGVNPNTAVITQGSADWVKKLGLLGSFPEVPHHKILLIGELVARTHPSFAVEQLQLIADWSMWLFINDDLFDHLPFETLYSRTQLYVQILKGEAGITVNTPFAQGLFDLWQRTQPFVSDMWKTRFIQNLEDHFDALLWEYQTKITNQVPDVETYLHMRSKTSGFDAYIDLLDIGNSFVLPPEVQYGPAVRRLSQMANNIASWANEIFSVHKEVAQGDHLLNLVWLYHYNKQISLAEAIEVVRNLCQAEIDMFEAQVRHLPAVDSDVDVHLRHYISLLEDVIHGTLEWHFVTDRYQRHWGALEKSV